ATVRAGVLPMLTPRAVADDDTTCVETVPLAPRGRIRVLSRTRDDDLDLLAEAHTVIDVGIGVPPDAYADLEPLRTLLGAQRGAGVALDQVVAGCGRGGRQKVTSNNTVPPMPMTSAETKPHQWCSRKSILSSIDH